MAAYFPKKGDFVALTIDPQAGRKQKGRRPALIVSNNLFKRHIGMAIACPITNTDRHYPFNLAIEEGLPVTGFVMVDQVKSIDFRARRAKRIGKTPDALLNGVLAVLDACVY